MEGILTYNSRVIGSITAETEGLFAYIKVSAYIKQDALLRAYLVQDMKNLPVGIIEPCGENCLKCEKKISLRELNEKNIKIEREFSGILVNCKDTPESGWIKDKSAEQILLKNGFYDIHGGVFSKKTSDGKILLGALIDENQPYALMPSFSISTPVQTDFGILGVVQTDEEGNLSYYE